MHLDTFNEIHEQLICSIEDLVEDYTSQARSTIGDLEEFVKKHEHVPNHVRDEIVATLEHLLGRLHHDPYDLTARRQLVRLRFRIRNTICLLRGEPKRYNYGEPFEL